MDLRMISAMRVVLVFSRCWSFMSIQPNQIDLLVLLTWRWLDMEFTAL